MARPVAVPLDPARPAEGGPELSLTSLVQGVTASVLRMQIFLLLYVEKQLYHTEICKKLGRSKATVSRNLDAMRRQGLLDVKEGEDDGSGRRKYYRIPEGRLKSAFSQAYSNEAIVDFLNPARRLQVYARAAETVKSLIRLFSRGFSIVQPLVDSMERSLGNVGRADQEFARYLGFLVPTRMIHFAPILVAKERVAMANALFEEYWAKLAELRREGRAEGERDSVLIFHAMVPLKDIIEANAAKG